MSEEPVGTLAELLAQARQREGLTQSQLAAATSIAQPNISDYESGRRSPTVRTLLRLLHACDAELMLRPRDRATP